MYLWKKLLIVGATALLFVSGCFNDASQSNKSNTPEINTIFGTRAVHHVSSISQANSIGQPGDTVYIAAGTYSQTLRPGRSGEPGKYITYKPEGGDVIIRNAGNGIDLHDRSYIIIDNLKIEDTSNHWVYMEENAHYNIIKNCSMKTDSGKGIYMRAANHNKFLNNTLRGLCKPSDLINMRRSNYNLIEGNDLSNAAHLVITINGKEGTTGHNIVRNNIIRNPWHANLSIYRDSTPTLIEGNKILDAGDDYKNNSCGSDRDRSMPRFEHKGLQIGSPYLIIRYNISVNNGKGMGMSAGDSDKHSNDLTVYSNVFNKNIWGIGCNSSGDIFDNIFKNNISWNNVDYDVRMGGGSSSGNYFINNNIGNKRYNDDNTWQNNLSVEPRFVNESNRDFHPQQNSPMIDAGAFLTETVNSGNGTTMQVKAARYFMDGWGIIQGDLIQLQGQTQTARITNVNYSTNTLTLDRSLTWSNNQGVSLPYNGSKPDIGAHEYGGTTPPPDDTEAPTVPANLTATAMSSSQINLSWNASTDNVGVTGYKIFRDGAQVATTADTSYADTGLAAQTTYTYTVKAYDAAGDESGESNQANATTQTTVSEYPVPILNSVTVSSNGDFALTWTNPAAEAPSGGYDIIYDGIDDGLYRTTNTQTTVSGLAVGTHCFIIESRFTQADPSQFPRSNEVCADSTLIDIIAPSKPESLTATAVSSSQVDLSWQASTDDVGVTGYKIFREGIQVATTTGLFYADTGLQEATQYTYTVTAHDAAGNESNESNQASATTQTTISEYPAPILNSVTASSNGDFMLTWTNPAAEAPSGGYDIIYDGTDDGLYRTANTQTTVSGLSIGTHCFVIESRFKQVDPAQYPRSLEVCADSSQIEYPAPVLSSVTVSSNGDFMLTWTNPAAEEPSGGYDIIYDGIDDGTYRTTNTQTTVSGLSRGTHCFVIESRFKQIDPAQYPRSLEVCADSSLNITQAESGIIYSPMEIATDANASGGSYIQTSVRDEGTATFTITIPEDGEYKIIGRVFATDGSSNSLYMQINFDSEITWHIDEAYYGAWNEVAVTDAGTPYSVQLFAGEHTVSIRGRETDAKLDYFYFIKTE